MIVLGDDCTATFWCHLDQMWNLTTSSITFKYEFFFPHEREVHMEWEINKRCTQQPLPASFEYKRVLKISWKLVSWLLTPRSVVSSGRSGQFEKAKASHDNRNRRNFCVTVHCHCYPEVFRWSLCAAQHTCRNFQIANNLIPAPIRCVQSRLQTLSHLQMTHPSDLYFSPASPINLWHPTTKGTERQLIAWKWITCILRTCCMYLPRYYKGTASRHVTFLD